MNNHNAVFRISHEIVFANASFVSKHFKYVKQLSDMIEDDYQILMLPCDITHINHSGIKVSLFCQEQIIRIELLTVKS